MAPDQVNGARASRFSGLVSIEVGDKSDECCEWAGQKEQHRGEERAQDCARPLKGAQKFIKYGACEPSSAETNKNQKKTGATQVGHLDELKKCARSTSASGSSSTGDDELSTADGKQQLSFIERLAKVVPGLGIMLALCASASLGTAGMLVKLTVSVHGIQVAVFRAVIQMIIYSAIISVRRIGWTPARNELVPVALRAILGGTSITFSYYALKLIPLGDATTIRFSLPIWTLIMSYFFLGESCNLFKVCAVIISVAGVVLIAKPDECVYLAHLLLNAFRLEADAELQVHARDYERARVDEMALLVESSRPRPRALHNGSWPRAAVLAPLAPGDESASSAGYVVMAPSSELPLDVNLRQFEGCMMALASSICLSLSLIALRMCKQTPAEITILWLSLFSVLIGSVTLLLLNEWRLPNNLQDLLYILLNGLCGSIGQWFITSALKVEQSGIIALARTFDIEIAFLYSALLLGEQIRATSILGSVMVSLGVIIVVVPRLFESSAPAPAPASTSSSNSLTSGPADDRNGHQTGSQSEPAIVTSRTGSLADRQPEVEANTTAIAAAAAATEPPDARKRANGHLS